MDAGLKRARMTSLTIVLSLLGAMVLSAFIFPQSPYLIPYLMATPSTTDVVIGYAQFEGRPVQMVVDTERRKVWLRIPYDGKTHEKDLAYLKQEVLRLTNTQKSIVLGNTGYTFAFKGGYPIWGPFQSVGPGYHHDNLLFGEEASIVDTRVNKEVQALGTKAILGFWPYKAN